MPREDPPDVSIVIVTWNGRVLLETCLPGVLATDYPSFEVVVVDNGSTDGTVAWLETHYPGVRVVALDENRGFCGGNNAGIGAARGRYVMLLNNDVEVPAEWLGPLVAWMESHPETGAVQPKLLRYDRRTQFEYAGAAGGFLDAYGYPFTRGRIFSHLEPDGGQYDAPQRVFWATGAALLLRRTALDSVGLLDERFFMHMEEIDLCWRLQRAGHHVYAVPQSHVYHIGGASLPQGNARKTYFNFRNNLLLLYKNLTPRTWARVFPARLALDALAAARFAALRSWSEVGAVVRAYRDAHRMKRLFADERPLSDGPFPPYLGSIAAAHFAGGITTFSALSPHRFATPYRPLAPLLEPDGEGHRNERDAHAGHAPRPRALPEQEVRAHRGPDGLGE